MAEVALRLRSWTRRLGQRNTLLSAKRNVEAHYDIDGRIYDLFLDRDRQYSCAYFEQPGDSLDAAQEAKKRHVAAKLLLKPGQSVLDIGCGWGGLALYVADECGADVTGITLSQEQLPIARARAERLGLASKAKFKLADYRDVNQKFDRIVSVGMFEHVGLGYYDAFFKCVADSLKETALRLFTRSAIPLRLFRQIHGSKIHFSGRLCAEPFANNSGDRARGPDCFGCRGAQAPLRETLKEWRRALSGPPRGSGRKSGERFCRMWEFYLALSEAAFRLWHNRHLPDPTRQEGGRRADNSRLHGRGRKQAARKGSVRRSPPAE